MAIPRIYNPQELHEGISSELGKEYFTYIKDVLRLKKGAELTLFDGMGHEYSTIIRDFSSCNVCLDIIGKETIKLPATHITLAQSLPKGSKMEMIIQKSTELRASRIVPFISSRSIPRLTGTRATGKAARWRKIAIEASRQCGRGDVPEVSEIVSFDEMLGMADRHNLRIILWEAEPELGIREILTDEKHAGADSFFIVIGPEGGFSWEEIEKARQCGFIAASLGRLILRTETAPLAILSILQYEKGAFGTLAD
ncbi:MAG: 16S rRNA (uracil(1498)-N(3))-methyltransferase [Thermodesulfobacteriota bacterium]|nr:16S rRNA (uracil(1498)-N(3))-methyltransferase [Thermodesulfobacteriota bacterium]